MRRLRFSACGLAALVTIPLALPPAVSEDVLEPSVQNEVDHALARAPAEAWCAVTNRPPAASGDGRRPGCDVREPVADVFGTNGLTRTAIALKLVSTQLADGRWCLGTNDVTVTALDILRRL